MPARTMTGRVPAKTQNQHGQNDVIIKLWHMAMPGMAWVVLTFVGLVLRLLFAWHFRLALLTAGLVVLIGGTVAVFDFYMRRNRATVPGRLIGPVTALLVTAATAAFVLTGFSEVLALVWFAGGWGMWALWALWLSHGDNRDLAKAFAAKAEPVGIGGARLFDVRHRRAGRAGGRPATVTQAGLQLPDGLVVGEVAEDIERVEGALRHAPGSWTVTSDVDDAGVARVKITNPRVLMDGAIPWPGPSAPGLSVAEPFRLGLRQDSELFWYRLLPSHSVKLMGMSGSAKSMGYAWNMIAEGITRVDYMIVAADVAKRRQFLGMLEPAMALPLAIENDDAIELLYALRRARLARCDYLARTGLTEWREGCGLDYLHALFEETPDILALLDRRQMEDLWVSLQRNVRSAGIRADSSQQSVHHSQGPTVARAQQGNWCFGVADSKEALLGLSETQRERGARPQLWKASYPGMCVVDTVTIAPEDVALPVRMFDFGDNGAERMRNHALEYRAGDRHVDHVTMEALLARPGPSPTSTDRNTGGRYDKAARERDSKPTPAEALVMLIAVIAGFRDAGRAEITVRDLNESGICRRAGRSRSWLYGPEGALSVLEDRGLVRYLGDKPRQHWAISPAPGPGVAEDGQEPAGDDPGPGEDTD